MSQAEKPNITSRLSRRAALAGIAGIAAAGAAVLPGAAEVLSGEHPDAELLALAGRFDPLFAEWCAHSLASDLDYFDFERLVEEKTGVKSKDAFDIQAATRGEPAYPPGYLEGRSAASIDYDHPRRFDSDRHDELTDKLFPLADEILSYRAHTREGLALQVQALMASHDETWRGPAPDEEPEFPAMREFIENVCAFVDVPFPPVPAVDTAVLS